jgi:hypothetical protein
MVEGLVYRAAGKELLQLMETKPEGVEAKDLMGLAQKYKLNDDSLQKLFQQVQASGALGLAQEQAKERRKEAARKENMVGNVKEATGMELPADIAGEVVKESLKPKAVKAPTVHTFTEGDQTVEKQWDEATQSWKPLSSGPRYKPTTAGGPGSPYNAYNLSPEQLDALNRAYDHGLDPYKVNSRTARIYADSELRHPGRMWNEAAAQAAFQRSNQTTQSQALLNSIDPLYDELLVAGKRLKNTKWPLVNRPMNWLKEMTGNEDVVAFNNLRDDTVAEIERGLLGTGVLSDSKYLRAVKNINSAQTFGQLEHAVKNTKIVIKARLEALAKGPWQMGGSTGEKDNDPLGIRKK